MPCSLVRPAPRTSVAVAVALVLATTGTAPAAGSAFPPYLSNAESLPSEVRKDIATVWSGRTLSRTTTGHTARVPLDLYRLFVDRPEITASAGAHLGVGHYRVTRTGLDQFDVEDGEGTRGRYRVIVRDSRQHVLLVRAQRRTRLLGDVHAVSVTALTLIPGTAPDGRPEVAQRLETTVRIEHRLVALVARMLLPLFPDYADRKIGEVFNIAARVSSWALEQPAAFCAWLGTQPEGMQQREAFAHAVPACAKPTR